MKQHSFLGYKSGSSILHKCPAWIKILSVPAVNILLFSVPPYFALFMIAVQTAAAVLLCFTFSEMFTDVKPVVYYAFLLFFMRFVSALSQNNLMLFLEPESLKETLFMLIKLFCMMQMASLVFKTSTSLQLREGLEIIERAVRRFFHLKNAKTVSDTVSVFFIFIPLISQMWNQIEKSWQVRYGKKGLKMYFVLLPVFFSVSLKKAWNLSRSICIRM